MPVTNMGILYHYSGFYSIIEGNNKGNPSCLPAVILYDTILQICYKYYKEETNINLI
jgi:hypothetical protein